jgi:cobalt/nickel transport system permease protein
VNALIAYPWAAHIFDGILHPPWLIGGFAVALFMGLLSYLLELWFLHKGKREFAESEIAQIALLTAAFYVVSLIHVRVGPTSVHLLFNGLLGVILRWRVVYAIAVGLFLQVLLFGHGGFTTLGVNICIMTIPALAAWGMFDALRQIPRRDGRAMRFVLVMACSLTWLAALVFSIELVVSNNMLDLLEIDPSFALSLLLHPATLLALLGASITLAALEPQLGSSPDFSVGLFIGTITVLLTMLFNFLTLAFGTDDPWKSLALLTFVAHMPIAALEGLVLGFAVGFLARVKPEMLRIKPAVASEPAHAEEKPAEEELASTR